MKITEGLVATLSWRMTDSQGELIDENIEGDDFYVGGDDLLPRMAEQMLGKGVGDKGDIYLQPEDAFGDYDANLLLVEDRKLFPAELEEGMMFEQLPEGCSSGDADAFYTVTEIRDDKVLLDGNHPLAGLALRIEYTVLDVRAADPDEIEARSALLDSADAGLFMPGDK
ncbi:MAG: peptidylprolyl isomerase [Thiomonas sp.]|uniref:FKBP-type peptidyl-prolyl cis-trans isomerase n=1 Tax=Thiomonas sp. TaxID=2047785 RepID=UPI002A363835|nr:peptidylprolyl isomerase [Thiomonas sp.]MDY0330184.1 peptidylprolyl isomerase [Thiomonas sp.]